MKLVTYNVFKSRKPGLERQLNYLVKSYDFVLVQEWVSSLKKLDEYCYEENFTFTAPRTKTRTGTCIISRPEHKTTTTKLLTKRRELGFTTKKSSIVKMFDIQGKPCVVVNIHSLNFVSHRAWRKELVTILEHIPENVPALFAGDFNTWGVTRFRFLQKAMQIHGFSQGPYEHRKRMKLDHIFSRGLKINSAECLVDIKNSDHYPIAVDFDFL
jgi:endonuclease/exonuclease/phosphatase (EEP) superfamily protein YafD